MYDLSPDYLGQLETIAAEVQKSDILAQYLEEEEEEQFNQLKEAFEPRIYEIYKEVAVHYPLQLVSLEKVLLDASFEGLFLPKILGYSVLRGEVNENFKYVRPQDHFRDILLTICNSANFDILKKRIGQSIQIGFALSSDIWVTNLINGIDNKRVRHYLLGQKIDRYRQPEERGIGYNRYARQFRSENFYSVVFPTTPAELTLEYNSLREFLVYRINNPEDNSSLIEPMDTLAANKALIGTKGHFYLCALYAAFFELPDKSRTNLKKHFNAARKELDEADELLLEFAIYLHKRTDLHLSPEADLRLASIVDRKQKDQLSEFFQLVETIHNDGYTNEGTQEVIKAAYLSHEGVSNFNKALRRTIFQYLQTFVTNLEEDDYPEFFEINKLFAVYIEIFSNQKFNQDLKDLSMAYVRKLLKKFTDKRGKDYQDIKKFVSATFLDFKFLTDKEIVNLFKTRRKRKKPTEA